MRKDFAELLFQEMAINKDIYLITGDLGYGLWDKIKDTYSDRFYNVGSSEMAKAEEQSYQAQRAKEGESGFDVARLGGNILNPASLVPAARVAQLARAKGLSNVGQAVAGGAVGGAMQPVVREGEFGEQKAQQVILGGYNFAEGQSVVITGVGAPFNGTFTILESSNIDIEDFIVRSSSRIYLDGAYREFNGFFTVAITNANITERKVIPSGLATLSGASTYVGNAAVESAVLAVSVEVFQSRIAPGGQIEGVDFTTVSPYRLGRSLFNRVSGLLGAFIDTDSMVQ